MLGLAPHGFYYGLDMIINILLIIFAFAFFYLTRTGFFILNYGIIAFCSILLFLPFLGLFRYLIFFVVLIFNWLFYPYTVPSGLSLFFGVPGSGKTSLASYICKMANRHNAVDRVYSNVPIKGTLKIDRNDIGRYDISGLDKGSLLVIDEAGIDFNNRFGNKKSSSMALNEEQIQWFKLYRHYRVKTFVCFSQRVDIDVTIRGLADRVYILKKLHLPYVVLFIGVKKILTVDIPPNSTIGQIADGFRINPLDIHMIFTPPLWKLFDTYDAPKLPSKEFIRWDGESKYTD